MPHRLSSKSLLITSSILDSYSWMKSAPSTVARGKEPRTWKECAYEDFVNSLNRISTPMDPAAQRGIDFENKMTPVLYNTRDYCIKTYGEMFGMFYDKCSGGALQAVLKRTLSIDDQDYTLYGRADVFFKDKIFDIKTTGTFKGPDKYTDRAQHLLYITASGIEKFEYLVFVGEPTLEAGVPWKVNSIIPIDASMSKDEATERLETRIRSFVSYLEANPEHLKSYLNTYNR